MDNKYQIRVLPISILTGILLVIIVALQIFIISGGFQLKTVWIDRNIPWASDIFLKLEKDIIPMLIQHSQNNIDGDKEPIILIEDGLEKVLPNKEKIPSVLDRESEDPVG